MKYIPASEVEKLGKEWDLAGDIEDGADRYELCLAHCAERLRALLASAVGLPEPPTCACEDGYPANNECPVHGDDDHRVARLAPGDKLREALETIMRRVPIMASTGDYRQGQVDALDECRKVARAALRKEEV